MIWPLIESLLESIGSKEDERLDYAIKLFVHHLERLRHLIEAKPMGGQQRRIHAALLLLIVEMSRTDSLIQLV
jgi:hypothetical protein